MSRYIPVRTTMDSEDHYHAPYDTHDARGDSDAHYEAPSCLKRNPSGSLFIPSGAGEGRDQQPGPGDKTLPLESRLRYTSGYSPHHTHTATSRGGAYSPQHSSSTSGSHSTRGGQETRVDHVYNDTAHVYNVGTLGTRLGNTLLSRQGATSPARSPATETYKHLESARGTLPSYTSGVYHPSSSHPLHGTQHSHGHGSSKRPGSHSGSSNTASFRLKSDLSSRCSWKFVAIFFMLFSFLLVSALIYTAASNYIISGSTGFTESAKACAVIEESPRATDTLATSSYTTPSLPSKAGAAAVVPSTSLPPDAASFGPLALGVALSRDIPAYSYWNFQLEQPEPGYIQLAFNIPRGSSIGLYARKNAIPSLTVNDIRDVLIGFRSQASAAGWREARASQAHLVREASYYLEAGHWFLSLYNDAASHAAVQLTAEAMPRHATSACPRGCSGHGECVGDTCECAPGYTGQDCSLSTCPVLCSNNGEYEEGACRCYPGWKGAECSIRHSECEVPDCSNHGACVAGECQCSRGYTGQFCELVDCVDPHCSGHGYCVAGSCVCRKGWTGESCGAAEDEERRCLPDCSGHGAWDMDAGRCVCHAGFRGEDCATELCDKKCGEHGHCAGGACVCAAGWAGDTCSVATCDARCGQHGMCSNGTCLCTNGWNGRHCTLEGCPGNCNGHGTCSMPNYAPPGSWECLCESGWYGPGCDIRLEQNCDDKQDNDKDGLVDCEDPECCEAAACEHSQLCHTVSSPIDILLRKQPPAVTASFYERMRFIIEDRGLQSYAKKKGFNESRAAVVRGQVVTPDGMGLIGVRVSTNGANEGFTMTRQDGWFDLMVNGGGPVMLQFGRNPYSPLRLALSVPWNEVMVLAPVKLQAKEVRVQVPELNREVAACPDHDHDLMRPIARATWQPRSYSGASSLARGSRILAESQVVQEAVDIPGSAVRLMYHSSRAKGYYSTIQLQLTPDTVPESLVRVHLVISIEGVLEQKLFEADPRLQHTYYWDRLNIYRQRVYGVTTATVKVGYEYTGCAMVWSVQTVKVPGHDMVLSDIGGWNLDVQHKYNFHEGILQKGDGSNIYLQYKPLVVTTLMGDGAPRPLECRKCEGEAAQLSLLAPKSLAVAPDGSVYVADHDLIRRIAPDGTVRTVLKLNSTRVSYRYHLAHRSYTGELEMRNTVYVSLPESHMVIMIKSVDHPEPVESNYVRVIGTGERCLPGDADNCGDGGQATKARLSYPKGIAIGPEGRVYIADGNNIRMVDEFGVISTLAGTQHHRATWKPMPCSGSLALEEAQLSWPTELAISPLDSTLHIIDDDTVLQLTKDGRVRVAAGRPLHCHASQYGPHSPQSAALSQPQSIAFSATGELFIAESDSQRINRVRRVGHGRQIETIAGKNSNCNCLEAGCKCWDPELHLAATTRFGAISSIAVSPDGALYVADQGNYRVRTVASRMPTHEDDAVFEVPDPDSQELYVFNRFGQHVQTKELMTGAVVASLEYHQSTSSGRLVAVTDRGGRKVSVVRDYAGQVTALQTSAGLKLGLRINRLGYLDTVQLPGGASLAFQYVASSGLLLSRLDSANLGLVFSYDRYGRLTRAVAPTGEVTRLRFNLTEAGGNIAVLGAGRSVLVTESRVLQSGEGGQVEKETVLGSDGRLEVRAGSCVTSLEAVRHPVISARQPVLGASYPMVGGARVELGGQLVSSVQWEHSLQTSGHGDRDTTLGITKKLRVNGEQLLVVAWDQLQRRELLYTADKTELLEIKYDEQLRPVTWVTPYQAWAPVSQRYDRFGHLESWRWGDMLEQYSHDKEGRLVAVTLNNVTALRYEYPDTRATAPNTVTTARGAVLRLHYDEDGGLARAVLGSSEHAWSTQPGVGGISWSYRAPWTRDTRPYTITYNARGLVTSVQLPSGRERVSYVYSDDGRLVRVFSGQTEVELGWAEGAVTVSQGELELRDKRKHHGGLLKEQKLRFSGVSGLSNAALRYQLDGTGRPVRVTTFLGRQESPACTWQHHAATGQLQAVAGITIRRTAFNRTELSDPSGGFGKLVEVDRHGNIRRLVYTAARRTVYSLEMVWAGRRLAARTTLDQEARQRVDTFSYSPSGQLEGVTSPGQPEVSMEHDEEGNLVTYNQQTLVAGPGGRVQALGSTKVEYDDNGFVSAIGSEKFLHDGLGRLVELVTAGGLRVRHYYDQLGRLVAWADSAGGVQQYLYTNPLRPWQLTYVASPDMETQQLSYDHNDQLVMIQTRSEQLYVATDHLGSPVLVFRGNGNVVKQLRYSAYGEVVADSQPSLRLPVGYRGGLASPHSSSLLWLGGRGYSASIAQWLGPAWQQLLRAGVSHPHQLALYRFLDHDPLRPGLEPRHMTSMQDWASLYGYDMASVFHASTSRGELYGLQAPDTRVAGPEHEVISELDTLVDTGLAQLHDLRFVRSGEAVRRLGLLARFSSRAQNFGRGFLLSVTEQSRAVVAPVEVQNSVVQKIFESVLNNSVYLDLSYEDPGGKSVYYFVKPTLGQFSLDSDTTRRLAGEFTVTPRDIDTGKELSVANAAAEVRILYGASAASVRADLLKQFNNLAVTRAWARERDLVARGFSGAGRWGAAEVAELLSSAHARVRGYEAAEVQSSERWPQLARDPTNLEFVRVGQRPRRNRHGRRKHVSE